MGVGLGWEKEEWEESQGSELEKGGGSGRQWVSGWRLETATAYSQLCHAIPGPLGLIQTLRNEDSTSFAPVLVGFLPDISGFQPFDCSRGSLGSQGNYE